MNSTTQSWFIGGFGLGLVLCIWFGFGLLDAKQAASDATQNLAQVVNMQSEITELRTKTSSAHMVGEQPAENASTWAKYVSSAGIDEGRFSNIHRRPLSPIPDTSYSKDDVTLDVTSVSLEQVLKLLVHCSQKDIGYNPISVHLTARPSEAGEMERWDATLVLTRILFTATSSD